jgi:iron complex outermembrane receptor protein
MSWTSILCIVFFAAIQILCGCAVAAPGDKETNAPWPGRRLLLEAGRVTAREHARSLHELTGYDADPGECGEWVLGPLKEGEYTGKEAWLKLIEPVCSLVRRPDGKGGTKVFASLSNCECSFGLPRHMFVTNSSLPLDQSVPSPVLIFDRRRIDETGAASVPDLLRYASQTAFHRSRGFRASGAQYAELRGLGAGYTLVLINGRRAFGTASDLGAGAVDLSMIPISAVERVDISMDANSLVHGMDAVGGIVNVVLRDSAEPFTEVRYGWTRGGGSQSHASLSLGSHSERFKFAVFGDFERWQELLGRERDRWNNQDFRRPGGEDYRLLLGAPATVFSTNGANLPGLDRPAAAATLNAENGMLDFVTGEPNRTSIRAFQAIVPASDRESVLANGSLNIGPAKLSAEVLAVRRESELQLMPSIVAGMLGKDHPDNSFHVPVNIQALLAGLPAMRQHFETSSRRGVLAADMPFRSWEVSAFAVYSRESADAKMRNIVDPDVLARGLQGDIPDKVLSLYSTVLPTTFPEGLFKDGDTRRYHADASHFQLSARGSLWQLPAGPLMLKLGVERRLERMDFETYIDGASRDITSAFAHLSVPVIGSERNWPAVKDVSLLLGARRDDYSDLGRIDKWQLGLHWRPSDSIRVQAATSTSFRPPSLVELNMPQISIPSQIFDAQRNEVAQIELTTGGNAQLQPSTGRSNSLGVVFQPDSRFQFSAEYWRVKVRNHVALLTPISLLAHEDSALPNRVQRANPTGEELAAGRRGRLLMLDISRANVGGALARGVDLTGEATFKMRNGTLTPRISVTLADKFEYSDAPSTQSQLENRVGVASELGTIPKRTGVASVTYESDDLRISIVARDISSYRDRSDLTGAPLSKEISSPTMWDFNVSKRIARNLSVTLGAINVTDREPPFARAGGSLGFDASQGDLEGRQIYSMFSGTF